MQEVRIEDFNQYELYVRKSLQTKNKEQQKAMTKLILQAFTDGIAYANKALKVEIG